MSAVKMYTAKPLTEQFEILNCRVRAALGAKQEAPYVLAFTSCEPGEGVTNIAVNFTASLLSDRSCHVLLVDANLSRPNLQKLFHCNGNSAFVERLEGKRKEVELFNWQVLQASPNLDVILGRHVADRHHRNFEMKAFSNFLIGAKDKYDFVILDCPAISESSSAAMLASRSDGTVLVVEAERIRREVIQRSVILLEDLGVNLLGVVLNKRKYPIPRFIYNLL